MDISKQIALVTGSNRGLGRHLAQELLSRGAKVYAGARSPELVDLQGVTPLQLDITNDKSVAAAAEAANDVTLLINNAGVNSRAALLDGDINKIHLDMNTHFFGTLSMMRAFAPILEKNGGGTILNILSVLSWFSLGGSGNYSAAKAAEWSLTNSLRLTLAPKNIRVCGLHVGYMDTDMTAIIQAPKENPSDIAKIAIDGIEMNNYEIVADEYSHNVLKKLSGGVNAMYPQLFSV